MSSVEVMNFYMRFYWIKLLKFFFISHAICSVNWLENIYEKKPCNPPIHEWWNIMNWYLSQFWYIISMQFSLPLFHLVCTLCHERFAEFIFHFFSLSTTQTMKMFRIFIAAQIDIYFCNIYMRPSTTTTKKASFRIDDVNLLHHRQSWCWWMKWNVNDLIY